MVLITRKVEGTSIQKFKAKQYWIGFWLEITGNAVGASLTNETLS